MINQLRRDRRFDQVFFSQDWHPETHCSFAVNNKDADGNPAKVMDVKVLDGIKQVMWPTHCVQNSDGAQIHPDILRLEDDIVVRKGNNRRFDSYSAFQDNGGYVKTELERELKKKNVTELYVCGLATDFCVSFSVLDAVERGFRTYFIEDASRGIDPKTTQEAIDKMRESGVTIVQSRDVPPLGQ